MRPSGYVPESLVPPLKPTAQLPPGVEKQIWKRQFMFRRAPRPSAPDLHAHERHARVHVFVRRPRAPREGRGGAEQGEGSRHEAREVTTSPRPASGGASGSMMNAPVPAPSTGSRRARSLRVHLPKLPKWACRAALAPPLPRSRRRDRRGGACTRRVRARPRARLRSRLGRRLRARDHRAGFAHAPKLDPERYELAALPVLGDRDVMMALGARSRSRASRASRSRASRRRCPTWRLRTDRRRRAGARSSRSPSRSLSPWSLWLGAATVPESFTASFTAAAAIALGARAGAGEGARGGRESASRSALLRGVPLALRGWPAAAVLAVVLGVRASARRERDAREAAPSSRRGARRRRTARSGSRGTRARARRRAALLPARQRGSSARSARARRTRSRPFSSTLACSSAMRPDVLVAWSLAVLAARSFVVLARRDPPSMARPARLRGGADRVPRLRQRARRRARASPRARAARRRLPHGGRSQPTS